MPTVLVTGFGPWGSHSENPSWAWWREVEPGPPPGWTLVRVEIPVDWEAAWPTLERALAATDDLRVVLCCGLAANRTAITPERFAHNLASTTEPDIRHACRAASVIDPAGPVAYAATLPVPTLVAELAAAGLPAAESRDAGTFLCNFVSYRLLARCAADPHIRAGFIHVPPTDCLSPEQWAQARAIVLRRVLAESDRRRAEGSPSGCP